MKMRIFELEFKNIQAKLKLLQEREKILINTCKKLKNKTKDNEKYIFSLLELININPENFCSSEEVYHFLKNLN